MSFNLEEILKTVDEVVKEMEPEIELMHLWHMQREKIYLSPRNTRFLFCE